MDKLYDWLFHYNHYEELWYAFKSKDKEAYFNGEMSDKLFFKSKDFKTLPDYIIKTLDTIEENDIRRKEK